MRRWLFIGVAVVAILLLGITARRYVHGFTLVVRAADLHGAVRRVADLDAVRISERIVRIWLKGTSTSIRARIYAPIGTARQTVLLVSGLHPAGIDEPRLVALARRLAEASVTAVTPEIPELSRFEITPVLTDRIEQAAVWLAVESGLAPTGRIGLMGISFSGGLAVVAAGRPSLRNHLLDRNSCRTSASMSTYPRSRHHDRQSPPLWSSCFTAETITSFPPPNRNTWPTACAAKPLSACC